MEDLIRQAKEEISSFYGLEGYYPVFLWSRSMQASEDDIKQLEELGLIGVNQQDPIFETWDINWIVDKVLSHEN
jgi:hypothetical protein